MANKILSVGLLGAAILLNSCAEMKTPLSCDLLGDGLLGWQQVGGKPGGWGLDDGILYPLGDPLRDTKGGHGGWLATNQEYADFILELEFKCREASPSGVPLRGNSGVFIRAPLEGDPAYMGMEIQISFDPPVRRRIDGAQSAWGCLVADGLDDYADTYSNLRPEQFTGSLYGVQAPSERVTRKAGEWQKMVITCKGPKVQVIVNGKKVVDTSLEYYSHMYDKHPGLTRTSGYVGLQDHTGRVEFRNVRIRQL